MKPRTATGSAALVNNAPQAVRSLLDIARFAPQHDDFEGTHVIKMGHAKSK
jgi:hypothetical protein